MGGGKSDRPPVNEGLCAHTYLHVPKTITQPPKDPPGPHGQSIYHLPHTYCIHRPTGAIGEEEDGTVVDGTVVGVAAFVGISGEEEDGTVVDGAVVGVAAVVGISGCFLVFLAPNLRPCRRHQGQETPQQEAGRANGER